jgi:hypothetical protein
MEMNMRRTVGISCLLVVLSTFAVVAQEVGNDVQKASISLFGENVGTIAPSHVSVTLTNLCPDTTFYTAIMVVPLDELEELPTANPPRRFAIHANGQAFSLVTAKHICAFLAGIKKPVADELSAYKRSLAFAELIGGSVRTAMPEKESIITRYKEQKPESWPIVIEGTQSGWNVSLTLMTDTITEYCIRYTLRIDSDGKTMELAEKQTVYTYTMYE